MRSCLSRISGAGPAILLNGCGRRVRVASGILAGAFHCVRLLQALAISQECKVVPGVIVADARA